MRLSDKGAFGLIEVMIAVAIIAGAALLVSQFVSDQTKQQIRIRNSSSCEASLAAILSEIKQFNNNAQKEHWLPKAYEISPPSQERYLQLRVVQPIFDTLDASPASGVPYGTVLKNVSPRMSSYSSDENDIANSVNSYQLIYNSATMLNIYYSSNANYCGQAEGLKIARNIPGDFLSQIVTKFVSADIDQSPQTGLWARISHIQVGAEEESCSHWEPVPLNVSAHANSNNTSAFKLSLRMNYQDDSGNLQSCESNAIFSQGSDLVSPEVIVEAKPVNLTARGSADALFGADALNASLFCGSGSSIEQGIHFVIRPSVNPEYGTQYVCRLDYLAGREFPTSSRNSGTGWFICSMPEASIQSVITSLGNLRVQNVTVSDASPETTEVSFTVSNLAEGTYKLHVKAIDTARNERLVSRSVAVDLSRPTLNIVEPYPVSSVSELNAHRFQCSDRNHSSWGPTAAGLQLAATVMIENYHDGVNLVPLNCRSNSVAPPNNVWASDGPKTAQFLVCDECNIVLNTLGEAQDRLWFVDTIHSGGGSDSVLNPSRGNLGANRRFSYDAGKNDGNPYVIEHKLYREPNFKNPNRIEALEPTLQRLVRNMYSNRVLSSNPVVFDQQSAINACIPYGTYSYRVQDGCGDNTWTHAQRVKSSGDYIYSNSSAGTNFCGFEANQRHCPTFAKTLPVADSCQRLGLVDCSLDYDGGYCGKNNALVSSCIFYESLNRACKKRPCPVPEPYRHLVDHRTSIEHGEGFSSCKTSARLCGGSCDCKVVTCNDGHLPEPVGSIAKCDPAAPCLGNCPPVAVVHSDAILGEGGVANGPPFSDQGFCNAHPAVQSGSCVSHDSSGYCGKRRQ